MTPIQERGRARLKLRFPDWRDCFDLASSLSFLEVCEAYELACTGLEHWTKLDNSSNTAMVAEYRGLVTSLALDAQLFASRDTKSVSRGSQT